MKTVCLLFIIVFEFQLIKTQSGIEKRCQGKNVDTGKCCTEDNPCVEGEGDCENNEECEGNLLCGNNNCKQFGDFFHARDDCCVKPERRCRGRHVDTGKCCTEENPCVEEEGDCENDAECGQGLVCGKNNCKMFGDFFDQKDDCCVKPGKRCRGRHIDTGKCCTEKNPCVEEEGDCENDKECGQGLVCGKNNCKMFGDFFDKKDDCCVKHEKRCKGRHIDTGKCCTEENPCVEEEGDCENDAECKPGLICGKNNCKLFGDFFHEKDDCCINLNLNKKSPTENFEIPLEPQEGQRCRGRNYDLNKENQNGKRCCTPEDPCNEGEGDCDGPGDGGLHDEHRGCKGELQCGTNNCKQFGHYYHEKDDCCERTGTSVIATTRKPNPNKAFEKPPEHSCGGRNDGGRTCCTPDNPCVEGEGDCDGPADGGAHDGDRGCEGNLVCGSNNCKKWGLYFHEKDDCCERPIKEIKDDIASFWNVKQWKSLK